MAIRTAEHIAETARGWIDNRFGERYAPVRVSTAETKEEQRVHPCAPASYKGKVAPDGWPISYGFVDMNKYLADKEKSPVR